MSNRRRYKKNSFEENKKKRKNVWLNITRGKREKNRFKNETGRWSRRGRHCIKGNRIRETTKDRWEIFPDAKA